MKRNTAFQLKHTKEREIYLAKSISKSYETNNTRRLSELECNNEWKNLKGQDVAISCIKDGKDITQTRNDKIREVFRNRWRKVFSHDQDAKGLDQFQLNNQEC